MIIIVTTAKVKTNYLWITFFSLTELQYTTNLCTYAGFDFLRVALESETL